uniref:Uncharacterized protein n=1 Tax=Timema poppense TaxID=170557 RepID=A0A7R9CGW2_TIMPO|nr:unnamed protein product [Timema poppensis]
MVSPDKAHERLFLNMWGTKSPDRTSNTSGPGFSSSFSPCSRRHDSTPEAMRYPYWTDGRFAPVSGTSILPRFSLSVIAPASFNCREFGIPSILRTSSTPSLPLFSPGSHL